MEEPRRLRIAGLHHVTLLVSDLEASTAFYRNLLGLRLAAQTVNDDDPDARHLIFGDDEGRPGTLVTCLEYPDLEPGSVGRGSIHHFALSVETLEELAGWRDHLNASGAPCTEIMRRTGFSSVYVRDPDGNVIELATAESPGAAEAAPAGAEPAED